MLVGCQSPTEGISVEGGGGVIVEGEVWESPTIMHIQMSWKVHAGRFTFEPVI